MSKCVKIASIVGMGFLLLSNGSLWANTDQAKTATQTEVKAGAGQAKQAQAKPEKKEMVLPHDPTVRVRHPARNPTYDKNLRVSLQSNYMKEAERWYDEGADVNSYDPQGRSLLYLAISTNRFENMKFLLHRRANVNIKNDDGGTPMEAAVFRGNKQVMAMLFERGASPNGRMGHSKETYIQYAVTRGFEDIAVYLLEKGASISDRYEDSKTLLHAAVVRNMDSMVYNLLKKGVPVSAVDSSGVTPLHEAAAKGYRNMAHRLIQAKADVDAKTQKQWTPLHHAARFGHLDMVRFLISRGAEPFLRNTDGKAPVALAQHMGHIAIAQYLSEQGGIRGTASRFKKKIWSRSNTAKASASRTAPTSDSAVQSEPVIQQAPVQEVEEDDDFAFEA